MSRIESVRRASQQWARDLTDVSGRNRLLYYRHLKLGTLDLAGAEPRALTRLLSGKPGSTVALSVLFRGGPDDGTALSDAVRRARAIGRKATENFEERGVTTLFLVRGMATWTAGGTRAVPASPVLMCNVGLHRRGASEADFDLSLDGEWTVNDALMRYLDKEFDVGVSGEELLGSKLSDARLDDDEVAELFSDLTAAARGRVPDFRIERQSLILGNFMYRKMPMVGDIEDNLDALAGHDLIAAVAGDGDARALLRSDHSHNVDPSLPDATPPADEYLVLDADSSQNRAVNAALAGESFVLQGPPGTGKSQTIANVIATMMARGRSVLFVAEKRAAIDAVTKRLTSVGLDGFVMDFHGGTLRRRELARLLDESLAAIAAVPPADQPELHQRLEESRTALSGYARALHRERDPWGLSFFEVQCSLLDRAKRTAWVPPSPAQQAGFPVDVLARLDRHAKPGVQRDLRDWADLAEPMLAKHSPWSGGRVTAPADARRAQELLRQLADATSAAVAPCSALASELGLADPGALGSWEDRLELVNRVQHVASLLGPQIFSCELQRLAADLSPAVAGLGALPVRLFGRRYRAARREILELWQRPEAPSWRGVIDLLEGAQEQSRRWAELGLTGPPRVPSEYAAAVAAHTEVHKLVSELAGLLPALGLADQTYGELAATVAALSADTQTLIRLPRLLELEQRISAAGAGQLTAEVRRGALAAAHLADAFEGAWLASIHREVLLEDGVLSAFDGARQDRLAGEFRADDRSHLRGSPKRVARRVAELAVEARNRYPDQSDLIRREASKKTRHLPLRRLFESAPAVLTAVRPCWAMSPLDVAQTLPPEPLFDLVIFDEASQVLPSDAIPALLRAPRAMVAGDSRQLPPTVFFDGAGDDEDEPEEGTGSLADYESILDVMDAMLSRRPLAWHYRSADERLITFSNRKIYSGSLTTFPGAGDDGCLDSVVVDHLPEQASETRSNSGEVRRVADLMIDHAARRPEETLGVIAMGSYHAERIEAELRRRLGEESSPELERFFDESLPERAFVKNLERVQGDERDAIILSVGYGKNPAGRLLYRFGPLNNEGGERRLNVAVTRARRRMTVVSSFSHVEMDPARSSAEGVRLLRDYLKYVESGGADLSGADQVEPLNSFELDVLDKLTTAGLNVVSQYGCSGYRIDFAVRHPTDAGRFALAVEADGAAYHSSRTARDRDRLRQEHLERLGWRFCRIWSTDWFNDHTREVARVLQAHEAAVREMDNAPSGSSIADRSAGTAPTLSGPRGGDLREAGVEVPVQGTSTDPRPEFVRPGPAPWLMRGASIDEHDPRKLAALARWVMSDGRLRTDEQIFELMFQRLGYRRRGNRIRVALQRAIEQAKQDE